MCGCVQSKGAQCVCARLPGHVYVGVSGGAPAAMGTCRGAGVPAWPCAQGFRDPAGLAAEGGKAAWRQRPSSLLWPRRCLGLAGVGKWGLASRIQWVSCAKQGQGYLLSWAQAGRLRNWLRAATPVPRSSSRNVPRKPLHPSSHPLRSICLDGEALADSYPLGAGSQPSTPALPDR